MKQFKNSENKKIAFVYDKLHPLHNKFLKSINCDFIPFSKNISRDYDIYVVEATYIKPILLKKIGRIKKEKKIITLFSDPRLFYLHIGKKFDFKKQKMVKYPIWRSFLAKRFIKEIDGAICIGDFSESNFRRFNKKSPILNIPAFVFKENAEKIKKVKPNLDNHNILFIGYGPDYHVKGIDLLITVFRRIRANFPDAELYILGNWDIRKEWMGDGIHFEGVVKDILPYLKKCSLSIHLGRGESFGINILETMLAGIPTIVSAYTGAKQAVTQADKSLVLPLNKEIVSKKIVSYFNSSLKEKMALSKKCRKVAGKFNEKDMLKKFRTGFPKFIGSIR